MRNPTGAPVALSNAEFQLLFTFLQLPRRVVSRDDLALQARGRTQGAPGRSIDLLVSRLRHKLVPRAGQDSLIHTVRGVDIGSMRNRSRASPGRSVRGQARALNARAAKAQIRRVASGPLASP